jgi:hypothetical protein
MRMQVCVPTQELPPPCLASEEWDKNGPPAGPNKAQCVTVVTYALCFWATSFADVGSWPLACFPVGGEHWIMGNMGNVLIIFVTTYVC